MLPSVYIFLIIICRSRFSIGWKGKVEGEIDKWNLSRKAGILTFNAFRMYTSRIKHYERYSCILIVDYEL